MATIQRLSRNQSAMALGSPVEAAGHEEHHVHHLPPKGGAKVENLNHASLIKPEELKALIGKMTIDDNDEILRRLDEGKLPFLFTSDDLSKMIEVTTSVRTKISIIGMVGPRLVDPKSKTAYFAGLFRYAEEKSAVEEILKARTQTLASAMFSKTDGIKNMSGRSLVGRGSPGRGNGGGRGVGNSRGNSSSSLEKDHNHDRSARLPISGNLSDDHDHLENLTPTQSGFDDVLSALDDLTPAAKKKRSTQNAALCAIDEGETTDNTPNSSSYSIADPRTTNDSSSVDSADKSPPQTASKTRSTDDGKIVLNKVGSSETINTKTPDHGSSATTRTTHVDEDVSSISSLDSGNNRPRSQQIRVKSLSYAGNFSSPPSSTEKKQINDGTFQSIKTITKKYSEAAVKSTSKDEQEVSHEVIAVTSSVAERTKAIANPLLNKKAAAPAQPTVGKVHASFPFQPSKSVSSVPSSQNDVPKVGKLSIIYPFASPKSSTSTPTVTSNTITPTKRTPVTTKVTYISSTRSLESHSSDNESAKSMNSSKSANSIPRCSTPRLPVTPGPNSVAPSSSASQPTLTVLSNFNPDKTVAGGAGSFNFDLATRCAMALKMTKEEFLALEEQEPVKIVDGIEKHTYCELVRRNFVKSYGNLVQTDLEKNLVEEEFVLAFQKTADQFFAQVRWRQVEQKKKALLF